MDAQLRVEELEESILEKDQEVLRLQQIVSRLQGEVRIHTHTLLGQTSGPSPKYNSFY